MIDTPGLRVNELHAGYGAIEVVGGVSLEVSGGEMVGLLGRNGAGKTTALRAIAGLCPGARGHVRLGDIELRGQTPASIAAAGVGLVAERHRIFRRLSVIENLRIGAFVRRGDGGAVAADLERVFVLFPALRGREHQPADQLSGGEQQMVALGQALMAAPRFLLLDEPTAGLAPLVVDAIYVALTRMRDAGVGLLIVEQTVERTLRECSRAYVMEGGRIVLAGDSATLAADDRIGGIVLGGVAPV